MSDRVELGSVVYRILFETGDTDKATKQVSTAFNDIEKKSKTMGQSLRKVKTAFSKFKGSIMQGIGIGGGFALVSSAISKMVGFIKQGTEQFVQFENQMRRVNTINRQSEGELKNLTKNVEALARVSHRCNDRFGVCTAGSR